MIQHVTGHSHPWVDAFPDELSMRGFLSLLGETAESLEWSVLAYCLMATHYHLLLRTEHANLGLGMRRLQGRHAQRLNRRRDLAGPLWRDRFHSRPVVTNDHLVQAAAYIDANPVAAGICDDPATWPWSSYRANVGLTEPPRWHQVDRLHSYLGAAADEADEVYRDLVARTIEAQRQS